MPVTCEAGKTGRDAASVASRPGSVDAAVQTLFAQLRLVVYLWAGEQRIEGSLQAHDSFDGILAEHALALEEICEEMRLIVRALLHGDSLAEGRVGAALQRFEHEITYVRSLGSVAQHQEEKDAHKD